MSDKDTIAFGSARAYRLAEEDENAARMVPLNTKDLGAPFAPIGPSKPVRRGATWPGVEDFVRRAEEMCSMAKILAFCPRCARATWHKVLNRLTQRVKCLICGDEHELT